MPVVTNLVEAVYVSVASALSALLSFIPALIGALIVLLIGWVIAGVLARLVTALLERVGFDRAAQRTGVTDFLSRTGWRRPRASVLMGELVKWFVRLIFLEAAASAVHLQAVTEIINRLVLFIPNLIVALVVLVIGGLLANVLSHIVRGATAEAGLGNPDLLATVARIAVLAFAIVVAVNQIGIATTLVNTLFMGLVFAVALALGLAFGLGGRDTAAQIVQNWYVRSQQAAPRIGQAAEAARRQVESPPPSQPPAAGSVSREDERGV